MRRILRPGPADAGSRIDRYLAVSCEAEGLSRSYLQKLLKTGKVLADGSPVKASYRLSGAERAVELEVPDPKEPEIQARPMDLDILYEDADILIVNKPRGMVVHPAAGHSDDTLVNGLMEHCRGDLSGINGVLRPGIVHRIDRDTSGILVVCKNDRSHARVAEQLKAHTVSRVYRAVVCGVLKEEEGTVDAPIGRNPADRKKMAVRPDGGRRAVTHYRVLERFTGYTYVECRLETGRTHQIRVHMAYIRHPVLGDAVYGPARNPFRLEGQVLHAGTLGLVHPTTGEYMEFEAPLPDYFRQLLDRLRKMQ